MAPSSTLATLLAQLQALPQGRGSGCRAQTYFKSSLTALSHAMEDQILSVEADQPIIIATFQQERFYRQEARRYERLAALTEQVYVLAAPETDFENRSGHYETIAFDPSDPLGQEWNLVVIGRNYASCLVCEERAEVNRPLKHHIDPSRRFEGIWTFDRQVSGMAAQILLDRVLDYRPELRQKVQVAREQLQRQAQSSGGPTDPGPFADRLVTHLQAGQYKLIKAYRAIANKERQERLVNLITRTIRQSLNAEEVLQIAVAELGKTQADCRCLIYACGEGDRQVTLCHESLSQGVGSLAGKTWTLENNPLFEATVVQEHPVHIGAVAHDLRVQSHPYLKQWAQQGDIRSWLLVPLSHQGQLLGMLELHYCPPCEVADQAASPWDKDDLALVEAIAPQISVALIQARAYADLEKLNAQLSALEQARYNLTAIVGHELRTPLATVKVCLESMASEPDMPAELRQVMVDTAVGDAERLRQLVEDFLTLSRLESGRVTLSAEVLPLEECVSLALSSLNARRARAEALPDISSEITGDLPLIQADGEWLVEVLAKLLDNACKFTQTTGKVLIQAQPLDDMLEVTITDTGRGIDPERLEAIFERFYQEEAALRRTAGGTGLGLAICRQIITNLGGKIWAESAGSDRGTQFHFTLPLAQAEPSPPRAAQAKRKKSPTRPRRSAS